MDRREFCGFASASALTGCGGSVEYEIQPTPLLKKSKDVYPFGVIGSWTPTVSFLVPGDVSATYIFQYGRYRRFGQEVRINFYVRADPFTHTTASGRLIVEGAPYIEDSATQGFEPVGACVYGGITKSGFSNAAIAVRAGTRQVEIHMSGSGVTPSYVQIFDVPTGGNLVLSGSVTYATKEI
jgi:hypothetical protein